MTENKELNGAVEKLLVQALESLSFILNNLAVSSTL